MLDELAFSPRFTLQFAHKYIEWPVSNTGQTSFCAPVNRLGAFA